MRKLDDQHYIRHKLFAGDVSSARRYRNLVMGEEPLWRFLRYEVVTSLLGGLPGALGLALRKLFYPSLFREIGQGVVFGRNVVIRNPRKIRLGNRVMIDDNCVIDARGAGEESVVVEDDVILNRGTMVVAKVGSLHIGTESDIGADSYLVSQGGLSVGRQVAMGGGCKIGGGLMEMSRPGRSGVIEEAGRQQVKVSRGPIRIGDRVALGSVVVVLDGVSIGAESIVGAGAVIREDIPPGMVVAPHQRLVLLPRPSAEARHVEAAPPAPAAPPEAGAGSPEPLGGEADPRTVHAIFAAIDDVNMQLPVRERLQQSLDAPLRGNGESLDSLVLINLLVVSEERLAEAYGMPITLTDPSFASDSENPLATVGSLIRFVERIRTRS
jgi:acetyltransferase-like isoleucine patch superfamily enzyme